MVRADRWYLNEEQLWPHHPAGKAAAGRVPPTIDELAALLMSCATSCLTTTQMDDEESTTQDGTVAGPLLITKAEAGEYLSVSIRTVERLISAGKLPLVHVEGAARLRVVDVEAYVDSLAPADSAGSPRSGGRVR